MDLDLKIPCPKCKREFKQALRLMKPKNSTRCPHCGTQIEFKGDDASKVNDSIQKSVNDLKRSFDEANRRLKR